MRLINCSIEDGLEIKVVRVIWVDGWWRIVRGVRVRWGGVGAVSGELG